MRYISKYLAVYKETKMDKIFLVLKLIPLIIEVIKAIEAAIPGQGQGEAKLAAVRGILETADSTFNNSIPFIENIIKILVDLFNKTGTFNKVA